TTPEGVWPADLDRLDQRKHSSITDSSITEKTYTGESRQEMTELTIRPEEIRDALTKYVEDFKPEAASKEEVGSVAQCGDGIARVAGLPSAMANELLEFEDGTLGLA